MADARLRLQLEAYRAAFDAPFAAPHAPERSATRTFLGFQIAGSSLALPLAALVGLDRVRQPLQVPGSASSLAGVVGLRGRVVAVHDLALLIDCPPQRLERPWLALMRVGTEILGLGLAGLDGLTEVLEQDIVALDPSQRFCGLAIEALSSDPNGRLALDAEALRARLLLQHAPPPHNERPR